MQKLAIGGMLVLSGLLIGDDVRGDDTEFERERREETAAAKDALEGKPAPSLQVEQWLNSDGPIDLKELQGKVVLIDFWGVWCGPCKAAIPHLMELHEQHKEEGLVIIGVHTTNQGEKMADYVAEEGIPYPVAVDVERQTVLAFHVDSYPDYYVIDRQGKLRFADLANKEVDKVIAKLLAEK